MFTIKNFKDFSRQFYEILMNYRHQFKEILYQPKVSLIWISIKNLINCVGLENSVNQVAL